jgi:lactoylglutathione lyase
MARGFNINRVGHIGVNVTDMDRSVEWYRDILGLSLTGRWPLGGPGREVAFMRFDDDHHNIVLFTFTRPLDEGTKDSDFNGLQHIAMEVENRDEWLKALADLQRKEVEIVEGPLIHGFEGGAGPGTNLGGSGSRSFYFLDPDGNRLELFTDMMKVPNGDEFPTPDYADMVEPIGRERAAAKAAAARG